MKDLFSFRTGGKMRTRLTNTLQIIILLTGIIYIFSGIFFFVSPLTVIEFFAENVSENWLDLVRDHELVGPLYLTLRAISALLLTSGVAMAMPLFDPLKYRGLVYYNGVIFPFLAAFVLIKNGIFLSSKYQDAVAIAGSAPAARQQGHLLVIILGVVFAAIALFSAIGLYITREQAKDGLE